MTRKPEGKPSLRERGLRWLAAGGRDHIEANLRLALATRRVSSQSDKASALDALAYGVVESMPPGSTIDQRVGALWKVIKDEVESLELPNERAALRAALHLDTGNREPSIDKRLAFARERGDFGAKPSGRRHGYDALRRWWGDGIRLLAQGLDVRLNDMHEHPEAWNAYFAEPEYRLPSNDAQPVFAELVVVTVFMKSRAVQRRITERLITARRDNVQYYTAWALPEMDEVSTSVAVRALWGCAAEQLPSAPGELILTKLWFPAPLQRGERHYFASEALEATTRLTERRAIDVEIDHHGIAPGERVHGLVPTQGLTIRICFDPSDMPEAVWWYADVTQLERYGRPEPGDERWVAISSQGVAEHTFADPCQPRANYGLSIGWPSA
jgi:hypothetical protein